MRRTGSLLVLLFVAASTTVVAWLLVEPPSARPPVAPPPPLRTPPRPDPAPDAPPPLPVAEEPAPPPVEPDPQARENAEWTRAEARAYAKAGSPSAVARFVEAIGAARVIKDEESAQTLERELAQLKEDLHRRHVEAVVERLKGASRDQLPKDDEIREIAAELDRGEAARAPLLVKKLVTRADSEHDQARCEVALRLLAPARRALERCVELRVDPEWCDHAAMSVKERELRCRLEEGGRAAQKGDGPAARSFLDLAELVKLDGRAPASSRVLYLLGRALEADGEPEEALKHYWAAIGTATWLARDTSIELVRWLARCRAAERPISVKSPGAGTSWRPLRRGRFVLFHEKPETADGLARRIDEARKVALARLDFTEPLVAQKPVVIVFPSEERYRDSGMAPSGWAGGHASHDTLEDGGASTLVVYDDEKDPGALDTVLVHEWAHILVDARIGNRNLPSWAVEGVATWTEPEAARARRLARAATVKSSFLQWRSFLSLRADPRYVGADPAGAGTFYAQALVAFEVAVRSRGNADAALRAAESAPVMDAPPGWKPNWFKVLDFKDEEEFARAADAVLRKE